MAEVGGWSEKIWEVGDWPKSRGEVDLKIDAKWDFEVGCVKE